jgi:hypothetical protein
MVTDDSDNMLFPSSRLKQSRKTEILQSKHWTVNRETTNFVGIRCYENLKAILWNKITILNNLHFILTL